MKDNISFSSDDGKISRKDLDETSKLAEEYFGMEEDPNQMPATHENRNWVYKKIPNYLNIIRRNEKIIGYAFLLPCNKKLMNDFIEGRINEADLFESIKKIKLDDVPEAIYLCASTIKEEFRRKGLATSAFVRSINKITHNGKEKPTLFFWEYSKEGGGVSRKVASIVGLELKIRE